MPNSEAYREAMEAIVSGHMPTADAVQFLREQNVRGVTEDEVLTTIDVLERAYYSRDIAVPSRAINIVGTGRVPGMRTSKKGRFAGISSATAIVLAAMGMPVLKHGGHGKNGSGSAAFFEKIFKGREATQDSAMTFVHSGALLPLHIADVRADIQEGTVFNLALPFATPFLRHEYARFIGVSGFAAHQEMLTTVARQYLRRKNSPMAIVVYQGHEEGGRGESFGEVSPMGLTTFCVVTCDGGLESRTFYHSRYAHMHRSHFEERRTLSAKDFVRIMTRDVWEWDERDEACVHVIALNAAFVRALCIKRSVSSFVRLDEFELEYERAWAAMRTGRVGRFIAERNCLTRGKA